MPAPHEPTGGPSQRASLEALAKQGLVGETAGRKYTYTPEKMKQREVMAARADAAAKGFEKGDFSSVYSAWPEETAIDLEGEYTSRYSSMSPEERSREAEKRKKEAAYWRTAEHTQKGMESVRDPWLTERQYDLLTEMANERWENLNHGEQIKRVEKFMEEEGMNPKPTE